MNYPILERIYDLTDLDFTVELRFGWVNEKGYFKTRATEEFNRMFNYFIKDMKNGYLDVLYYGYLNYVKKDISEKYLGANEIFEGSYYEQREYWIRTVEKFINELYNSREEKGDSHLWIEAYTRDGTGFYFRFYVPINEIDNIVSDEVISLIKEIRNPDSSTFMLPIDYFTLLELGSWIVFEYALHSYYYYLCRTIKNYDESKFFEKRANLKYMRQFYLTFPNGHALRGELSWTHYRSLMRVENENARNFYLEEAIKSNWSTRQLDRQINSFFYERLLSSQKKEEVSKEIMKLEKRKTPEDIIRDPYVLELLGLESNTDFYESDLEQALTTHLQKFLLELGRGFSFVARQKRFTFEG